MGIRRVGLTTQWVSGGWVSPRSGYQAVGSHHAVAQNPLQGGGVAHGRGTSHLVQPPGREFSKAGSQYPGKKSKSKIDEAVGSHHAVGGGRSRKPFIFFKKNYDEAVGSHHAVA